MTVEALRAITNLTLASLVLMGLAWLFLSRGSFDYLDPALHRPAATILISGAALWLIAMLAIRLARGPGRVDERDRAVALGALRAQVVAIQALLLVLTVVSIELHESAGNLPLSIPLVLFVAVVLFGLFVHGLASVVGYRRLS